MQRDATFREIARATERVADALTVLAATSALKTDDLPPVTDDNIGVMTAYLRAGHRLGFVTDERLEEIGL
jgi:hypothetical protein